MAKLSIRFAACIVNKINLFVMIVLATFVSGCSLLPTPKISDIIAPEQTTVHRTSLYTNLQAGDNAMLVEDIGDREGVILSPREALIIISRPAESPFEINYFSYDRSWWAYGVSALFWFFIAALVLSITLLMRVLIRSKVKNEI